MKPLPVRRLATYFAALLVAALVLGWLLTGAPAGSSTQQQSGTVLPEVIAGADLLLPSSEIEAPAKLVALNER
jgi:hypothetical protein